MSDVARVLASTLQLWRVAEARLPAEAIARLGQLASIWPQHPSDDAAVGEPALEFERGWLNMSGHEPSLTRSRSSMNGQYATPTMVGTQQSRSVRLSLLAARRAADDIHRLLPSRAETALGSLVWISFEAADGDAQVDVAFHTVDEVIGVRFTDHVESSVLVRQTPGGRERHGERFDVWYGCGPCAGSHHPVTHRPTQRSARHPAMMSQPGGSGSDE